MMHAIRSRFALPLLAGGALQKCGVIVQGIKACNAVLLPPLNCCCQRFDFATECGLTHCLMLLPTCLYVREQVVGILQN